MENSVSQTNTSGEPLSDDQRAVLDFATVPQDLNIKIENASSVSKETIQMNEAFELARIMYQDVLSPQLQENENLKRKQKEDLMKQLFEILNIQFKCTYIFVILLIIGALGSSFLNISENIVHNIINFVEFYITSIVVELLTILFFIIKNVFDTSIVELIRNFDKRKPKKDKKQQ